MTNRQKISKVNIRPGVTSLSILKHLNYRPWFALAEFVDNSIQSYLANQAQLKKTSQNSPPLLVHIEVVPDAGGQIIVRDNAGGIALADFPRAFRPAAVPPDISGLSEFGMGMKSAAFWFAPRWSVRTSALGENVERRVTLDIDQIITEKLEELDVHERPAKADAHFTELALTGLHHAIQTRTLAKIQEHLASIYRVFLRTGILQLKFRGEDLKYDEFPVLCAPYFKDLNAKPCAWRKKISFALDNGHRVTGFAGLFETGSTARAGFALLRRGRLVQGSADEGYRPEEIFGQPNTYTYQRLFGELELEGFDVSHTKDGFRWDDHEETFLKKLAEHLDAEPLPLLRQAEGHRVRPKPADFIPGAGKAADTTTTVIQRFLPPLVQRQQAQPPERSSAPQELPKSKETASTRDIPVSINNVTWLIRIELSADPAIGDWLSVSDTPPKTAAPKGTRLLCVRLSLTHPFMEQYAGTSAEQIEPFLRLAAAFAIAETTARDSGVKSAGTVRRNLNDLLRNVFCQP